MKPVLAVGLALAWALIPACKKSHESESPASVPVSKSTTATDGQNPSDLPPPPPPPSGAARKVPEYHVPRLLFVLAGSSDFSKNNQKAQKEISLAVSEFTRREMDYYDVGLVQTGYQGTKACEGTVRTTTAAGYKVHEPIKRALDSMAPHAAKTDLASALNSIREKSLTKKGKTMVIIITTGIDGCGGDVCAAAKALSEASHDLYVDLIGYQAGALSKKAFECVTKLGRGQYQNGWSTESLYDAIETALGKNICPPMAMPCWEKGLTSRVEANRARVVEHCCSLASPVAFRCPYKALLDPSEAIKNAALQCVLDKKWSRKPEAMRLALKDESKKLRSQVIAALELSPPTVRMKDLMSAASKDADISLASRSLLLVAKSGHPWAREILMESLSSPRVDIRSAVVSSSSHRYEAWVFEILKKASVDGSHRVRMQVVRTAGTLKDKRVLALLESLSSDKSKDVRNQVQRQLKALKGKIQ